MYEGGRINVAVGGMDRWRAELAYQGVFDVLSGKVPDRTGKAYYYQNPKFVDKYNRNWNEELQKTTEINSHVFYKFKEGSTKGPHAMDMDEPASQRAVYEIPQSQKPMAVYARSNLLRGQRFQRMAG